MRETKLWTILSNIKKTINEAKRRVLGETIYTKLKFNKLQGYKLNLSSPKTLSEKIQWIKIYGNLEILSNYVDKYEVRDYVRKKIGDGYLIPLIGVYENSDKINFSTLPQSFVVKATHASGWNLIVKDKNLVNWKEEKNKIDKWVDSSFYKITRERNYKHIQGRVVVEELIEDQSGDLKDYKFFCFDGQPKFIQVDGDRYENHKRDIYDTDWNKLKVTYQHGNLNKAVPKPEALDKLLEIARQLSSDFKFVRVDLYYTDDKIYFGELTFTPGQGFERFSQKQADIDFGKYLNLTDTSILKR
ncbi:ATP-grasp fold amidoligase family protein [Peribacillus frigoritolerans]|uniref:ATP-grasp fold amidoligase family protein n=1 Tax=Peribacillus frigoritolerans TaxID=450367 RepID=UPI003830ACE0